MTVHPKGESSVETAAERVRSATRDTRDEKVFAPSAAPAAILVGVVIGVALLGLVAVTVRELIDRSGLISGSSWSRDVADWFARLEWTPWTWVVAIALIVVGFAMLVAAVKPRRRTHVRLADADVVWTRAGDVARRTSASVESVAGVRDATTVVGRRRAKVLVSADEGIDRDAVRTAVTDVLEVLGHPPAPRIVYRNRGDAR